MDFYPNKNNNKNIINKKLKQNIIINNNNNDSNKIKKKSIISNKKQNSKGNFDFYKKNKRESWLPYHNTFASIKINSKNSKNEHIINDYNKITRSTFISPAPTSIRHMKRSKNRSLEFDDNDISSIKYLLKFKRAFIYWKNMVLKNKIIKKLRLISKIKYIINTYKLLYIKLFFSKLIQNIHKNAFYHNKINFNYILLNQFHNKLKEISKKKKIINDINTKHNNKRAKLKKTTTKTKLNQSKFYKNNNKINFSMESNTAAGLYYATQFNQKFKKLLNDKKNIKNNNIIIINNNINNNCQQLINNVKQKNNKDNGNNNYLRKNVNNNSMIDIQPTDTSLSCTVDLNNQSEKSLNSILMMNQMNEKNKYLKNTKNKLYHLNKIFTIINNKKRKNILHSYINQWKMNVILKKCFMKNKIINEKIIHFPKSPSNININNNYSNINNYSYNYMNSYNFTYNNSINNNNITNNNLNYTFNNNDLMINAMFTENNMKSQRNIFGNNTSNYLRNNIFTPSNKYSFYTQYMRNENSNNYNYENQPPRETEPKIIYHKKLFPSFWSNNYRQNNNNPLFIDYNYNKEERNNISFNNNMNNIQYGKNVITNFYSSNNFFNRRNNYHLENINNLLPEEKYGFKKINKIEEREISFSPSLSKKNHSFKNVINDNNYQNINNNNIYINVVENFRSDYQNRNTNISSINEVKGNNYGNNIRPINRNLFEEANLNKLMCHSHSQGFTKTVKNFIGNS